MFVVATPHFPLEAFLIQNSSSFSLSLSPLPPPPMGGNVTRSVTKPTIMVLPV